MAKIDHDSEKEIQRRRKAWAAKKKEQRKRRKLFGLDPKTTKLDSPERPIVSLEDIIAASYQRSEEAITTPSSPTPEAPEPTLIRVFRVAHTTNLLLDKNINQVDPSIPHEVVGEIELTDAIDRRTRHLGLHTGEKPTLKPAWKVLTIDDWVDCHGSYLRWDRDEYELVGDVSLWRAVEVANANSEEIILKKEHERCTIR